MSQEEALSLFPASPETVNVADTDTAAAAAATAAVAAGGIVVSEDGLWDMAPDDQDALFCQPHLERSTSSSWGLVHAPAALVADGDDNDNGNSNGTGDADADPDADDSDGKTDIESSPAPRATSAAERQQHQQHQQESESRASSVHADGVKLSLAGRQISFGWCEEECDFDGRSATSPPRAAGALSPTSSPRDKPDIVGSQCHFMFQGLQGAVQGYELRELTVRARFSVDNQKANVVERTASPLEADAGGRARATVTYPSMLEIWPEMYNMDSIRVMEVDMIVEVRSRDEKFVYTGPTLKAIYRRPATRVFVSTIPMARQTAGRVSVAIEPMSEG